MGRPAWPTACQRVVATHSRLMGHEIISIEGQRLTALFDETGRYRNTLSHMTTDHDHW